MSALTEPMPLPSPPATLSRYRSLRGKSVSESRKVVEAIVPGSPKAASEFGDSPKSSGSRFRRRAKTLTSGDSESASSTPTAAPPVPMLPPSPISPGPLVSPTATTPSRKAKGTLRAPPPLVLTDSNGAISHNGLNESGSEADIQGMNFPAVPVAMAITADTAVGPDSCCGTPVDDGRRRLQDRLGDDIAEMEESIRQARADAIINSHIYNDHSDAASLKSSAESFKFSNNGRRPSPLQLKPRSPVLEKFNFLGWGRKSSAASLSPSPSTATSFDFSRSGTMDPQPSPLAKSFLDKIGQPPPSPVPSTASNGGERCVQVRCRGVSMNVDVTLDTSTVDILFACSDGLPLPQSINTATAVVVESYTHLGLERRLRRYERVRDVLNSWDRDTQNHLFVDTSSDDLGQAAQQHKDLDISSVSSPACTPLQLQQPPQGFVLQLHHSQRPGKWNKRFITLLENGQMFASKKADVALAVSTPTSATGGSPWSPSAAGSPRGLPTVTAAAAAGAAAICHLSDFDIYTPTEAQCKKTLKAPKKFCYAIKSQQRTTVFAGSPAAENFVHFFCTEDADVARQFHTRVHAWRSWYLVHRRGVAGSAATSRRNSGNDDDMKPPPKLEDKRPGTSGSMSGAPQILAVKHKPKKSVSHIKFEGSRHKIRVSVDEAPYSIGEFQPLLDLNRFDKPIDEFGKDWIERQSALPPNAAETVAALVKSATGPGTPKTEGEFAEGGLLGASYDERKSRKGSAAGNEPSTPVEGPFTEGATLVNGGLSPNGEEAKDGEDKAETEEPAEPKSPPKPEPRSWFPSASEHSAKRRAQSISEAAARPSTSAGESSSRPDPPLPFPFGPGGPLAQQARPQHLHPGGPGSRGRPPPRLPGQPLVDINQGGRPIEPPQWMASGGGHGVRAPPGVPLVDMAGPTTPGMLAVPGRSSRRPSEQGGSSSSGGRRQGPPALQRPSTSDGRPVANGPQSPMFRNGPRPGTASGAPNAPPPHQPLPPVPRGPRADRPPAVEQWARGVVAEGQHPRGERHPAEREQRGDRHPAEREQRGDRHPAEREQRGDRHPAALRPGNGQGGPPPPHNQRQPRPMPARQH
ncbi:hypothetical protein RB597_003095 [Gaeumannomyces tritici]